MIDFRTPSAASRIPSDEPLNWEPEAFVLTGSWTNSGHSISFSRDESAGRFAGSEAHEREEGAEDAEGSPRVRLVAKPENSRARNLAIVASPCAATVAAVRRVLEGSGWTLVFASRPVELLAILDEKVDADAFDGHVLVDDAWAADAAGAALLEAVECVVPPERIVRLASPFGAEPGECDERIVRRPIRRDELERSLGIEARADHRAASAPASPVLDRSFWIDEIGALARFDGDHELWISLLGQFAARYERLPWRLGAELNRNGGVEASTRVRRVAKAAGTLGLHHLSSALGDLSESLRLGDSGSRRHRIEAVVRVHAKTFTSLRRFLSGAGGNGIESPLGWVDPLRAA